MTSSLPDRSNPQVAGRRDLDSANRTQCCGEKWWGHKDALKALMPFRSAIEPSPTYVPCLKSDEALTDMKANVAQQSEIRRPSPIAPPSSFMKAKVKNTFVHISDSDTNTSSDATSRLAMSDPLPMAQDGRVPKPCHPRGATVSKCKERADLEKASARSSSSNDCRTSEIHSASCPGTDWDFPTYQPPTVEALADLQRTFSGTWLMVPVAPRIVDSTQQALTPDFVTVRSYDGDVERRVCIAASDSESEGARKIGHSGSSDFSGQSEAGPPPRSMARVWQVWTKPEESQSSSMDESTAYASTLSGPQKRHRRGGKRMNRPCHLKAKTTDQDLLGTGYSVDEELGRYPPLTAAILHSAEEQIVTGKALNLSSDKASHEAGTVDVGQDQGLLQTVKSCHDMAKDQLVSSASFNSDSLKKRKSVLLGSKGGGKALLRNPEQLASVEARLENPGSSGSEGTKTSDQSVDHKANSAMDAETITIECQSGDTEIPKKQGHREQLDACIKNGLHEVKHHNAAAEFMRNGEGSSVFAKQSEANETPATLIGKRVLLQDLVRMPDFNGEWGKVLSYDEDLKRFKVSVPRSTGPPLLAKLLRKNFFVPSTVHLNFESEQNVKRAQTPYVEKDGLSLEGPAITSVSETPPETDIGHASKATLRRAALRKAAREKLNAARDSEEVVCGEARCEENAARDQARPEVKRSSKSLPRQNTTRVGASCSLSQRPASRPPCSRPPSCAITSSNVLAPTCEPQGVGRLLRRQRSCPASSARSSNFRSSSRVPRVPTILSRADQPQLDTTEDSHNFEEMYDFSSTVASSLKESGGSIQYQSSFQASVDDLARAVKLTPFESVGMSMNGEHEVSPMCQGEMHRKNISPMDVAPTDCSAALPETSKPGVAKKCPTTATRKCSKTPAKGKKIVTPIPEGNHIVDDFRSCEGKTVDSVVSSSNANDLDNLSPALPSTNAGEIEESLIDISTGMVRRKWKRHAIEVPTLPTPQNEDSTVFDLPIASGSPETQVGAISSASATKWRPSLRLNRGSKLV